GLGDGAGDRDEALVEDVLLREHGEVVDLDLAAQAGGAPRRDAVLAGAGGDADASAAVGEGSRCAGAVAADAVAKRRQQAVVGQAPQGAALARIAAAQQGQRIARFQPVGGIQGVVAEAPAVVDLRRPGRFQYEVGFELAAGVLPDRQPGAVLALLRHRGHGASQGKQRSEQQSWQVSGHAGCDPRPAGEFPPGLDFNLPDLCFFNNQRNVNPGPFRPFHCRPAGPSPVATGKSVNRVSISAGLNAYRWPQNSQRTWAVPPAAATAASASSRPSDCSMASTRSREQEQPNRKGRSSRSSTPSSWNRRRSRASAGQASNSAGERVSNRAPARFQPSSSPASPGSFCSIRPAAAESSAASSSRVGNCSDWRK